jgi:hypothetical protein
LIPGGDIHSLLHRVRASSGQVHPVVLGATPSGERGRSLKLTVHLHVVPKVKKSSSYVSKCSPGLIVG